MKYKSPAINYTLFKKCYTLVVCVAHSVVPFETVVYAVLNIKCVYNIFCSWFAYMEEQNY